MQQGVSGLSRRTDREEDLNSFLDPRKYTMSREKARRIKRRMHRMERREAKLELRGSVAGL